MIWFWLDFRQARKWWWQFLWKLLKEAARNWGIIYIYFFIKSHLLHFFFVFWSAPTCLVAFKHKWGAMHDSDWLILMKFVYLMSRWLIYEIIKGLFTLTFLWVFIKSNCCAIFIFIFFVSFFLFCSNAFVLLKWQPGKIRPCDDKYDTFMGLLIYLYPHKIFPETATALSYSQAEL